MIIIKEDESPRRDTTRLTQVCVKRRKKTKHARAFELRPQSKCQQPDDEAVSWAARLAPRSRTCAVCTSPEWPVAGARERPALS